MKIPLWKKWASHIKPITLEETGSEQNPDLQVVLDRGRLQLLSGNAIYSWDDLYRNFMIAFEKLNIEQRDYNEVLILGLGLGSIPYILEKKYHRSYYYTAIEWDEEVANLALKYTSPRLSSHIDVVTADAEVFVEVCEEMFDLIIVDIFEDDLTPPQFETPDFLENCARMLNVGGMLLYNRLHQTPHDITATERFYKNTFSTYFTETTNIDTNGNWILVYEKKG